MKRVFGWAVGVATVALIIWVATEYTKGHRYARPDYDVEEVDAVSFTVQIPRGWRRTNYSDPRESPLEFTASTSASDPASPYFVFGTLDVEDHGSKSVEAVTETWRKGQPNSPVSRVKLGPLEADTWTSQLPMAELAGEARTFVYRGANGHVYSAHYQLAAPGGHRSRQDYVFGRILASIKFK